MTERDVQNRIYNVLARHDIGPGSYCENCTYRLDIARWLIDHHVNKPEDADYGKLAYDNKQQGKRLKLRVGKFVRKYLAPEDTNDHTIQKVGADICAALWVSSDEDDTSAVKELRGEDLREFYLESVSGIGSCMAHSDTQEFLDIYADNPDVVSLAAVQINGHAARALVWTIQDNRYLDKIYCTSDACRSAIRAYAEKNGIGGYPRGTVHMKIRNGYNSYWPYLDTMCYMNLISGTECTLSDCEGPYCLQQTDGTCDDNGIICDGCGERVYEDDICRSSDGYVYCGYCYNERYAICDHCGDECAVDDIIYQDYKNWCQDCYDDHYSVCKDCQGVFDDDNMIVTSTGSHDYQVCEICLSDNYFYCDRCGEYYRNDEMKNEPDGKPICEDCFDDEFEVCTICDKVLNKGDLVDEMCSDCATDQMMEVGNG